MPATFDGDNLIITLPAGVTAIDVQTDLYSDWKEFLKTGNNAKYPLAFRTFGGDPLSASINAGAYFMFQNQLGWRIRPAEENATVTLNGNIAPEDPNLPITIPTVGAFTVLINGIQPITQNVDSIIDAQTIKVTNLQYMIESLRNTPGFGDIFYWDFLAGSDTFDALTPDTAGKTFAYVQSLTTSGNNDIIFAVNRSAGELIITERPIITSAGLSLRANGPSTIFRPTDDVADAITVSADNVSLMNFRAETTAAGTGRNVICAAGFDELTCENIFISDSTLAGIDASSGNKHKILGGRIQSCAGNGVTFLDTLDSRIEGVLLELNTGWAMELLSSSPSVRNRFTHIKNCATHHNGPGSLHIGTNTNMTIIREDNYFALASGNDLILDEGSSTHNDLEERAALTTRSEKWLRNKRVLDRATGIETLYDDDGTTVLGTRNVYEDELAAIAYDGTKAPHRVERYT